MFTITEFAVWFKKISFNGGWSMHKYILTEHMRGVLVISRITGLVFDLFFLLPLLGTSNWQLSAASDTTLEIFSVKLLTRLFEYTLLP